MVHKNLRYLQLPLISNVAKQPEKLHNRLEASMVGDLLTGIHYLTQTMPILV